MGKSSVINFILSDQQITSLCLKLMPKTEDNAPPPPPAEWQVFTSMNI